MNLLFLTAAIGLGFGLEGIPFSLTLLSASAVGAAFLCANNDMRKWAYDPASSDVRSIRLNVMVFYFALICTAAGTETVSYLLGSLIAKSIAA